jgi:hypothetical protein
MSADIAALATEVASLKRRLRLYGRALVAGAALSIGGAMVFAAAPLHSQDSRLTAQEITLVDAQGQARVVLSGENGIALMNSALAFYNEAGQRRLLANVADDEPSIYFLDREGRARMYLDVNYREEPRIGLNDRALKLRVLTTVDFRKNVGLFSLNDDDGKRRAVLSADNDTGSLTFLDEEGRVMTRMQAR